MPGDDGGELKGDPKGPWEICIRLSLGSDPFVFILKGNKLRFQFGCLIF